MSRIVAISVLLGVTAFTSCKPDDSTPCNGKANEVFIDASAGDSIYTPFFNQDTFKYRRTIISTSEADTITVVKTSESTAYNMLFVDNSQKCPTVYWGGQYLFMYKDIDLKDSLEFAVNFSGGEIETYAEFYSKGAVNFTFPVLRRFNDITNPPLREVTVLGKTYNNVVGYRSGIYFIDFQLNYGIISLGDGQIRIELLP